MKLMKPTQLYRHYNECGDLLYIGISNNPALRLTKHERVWTETVARSEIVSFKTREEAVAAEAAAIKAERPKLNKIHLPQDDRRGQHSMTSEQYTKAIAKLGMTQSEAADFLGISIRTSNSYANGRLIPESCAKLLRHMVKHGYKPEDMK